MNHRWYHDSHTVPHNFAWKPPIPDDHPAQYLLLSSVEGGI